MGLLINQIILPVSVVAQEITPTTEPTPSEVISPTPTEIILPSQTPIPTPTPELLPEEVLSIEPATDPVILVVVEPTPTPEDIIDVENSATVTQIVTADSNTGDNEGGQTETGNAVAVGNVVNMVNSTSIDSSVKVYLLNSVSGEMTELDLNSLWKLLGNETEPNVTTNISNYAQIINQVDVTANTGDNLVTGSGNNLSTGNAYALANIINLINTNFVGSRVFIGILNIEASNLGDIVLPSPESFNTGLSNYGLGNVQISNTANIETNANASSNTGVNIINGSNSNLDTGNAVSVSNVSTTANLNLLNTSQMMLSINTLGNWTGSIYNWANPGSIENGAGGLFVSNGVSLVGGNLDINIFNLANIINIINATANTGNNLVTGNNSITQTGNAYAIANVSTLANVNVIGSDWFYGMINIIGDWKGNAIFAYPDMAISLASDKQEVSVGDELTLSLKYENKGYDDANRVKINLNLPDGMAYVSDNSGLTMVRNGSSISWEVGSIKPKEVGGIVVKLRTDNYLQAEKLVKPAYAAEDFMLINSDISTINTEVTLENNRSSTRTGIETNNSGEINNLEPKLIIDVKNNVNDFVYDGDIVTYQVDARNEGESKVENTYLVHKIYDEKHNLISQNKINIGNVAVGGKGKVTFGIRVVTDSSQKFTTETVWMGNKENGDEATSNISVTNYLTKTKMVKTSFAAAPAVQAVSMDGQILGNTATCLPMFDLIPYLLLFIISSIWILRQVRKWQLVKTK